MNNHLLQVGHDCGVINTQKGIAAWCHQVGLTPVSLIKGFKPCQLFSETVLRSGEADKANGPLFGKAPCEQRYPHCGRLGPK